MYRTPMYVKRVPKEDCDSDRQWMFENLDELTTNGMRFRLIRIFGFEITWNKWRI